MTNSALPHTTSLKRSNEQPKTTFFIFLATADKMFVSRGEENEEFIHKFGFHLQSRRSLRASIRFSVSSSKWWKKSRRVKSSISSTLLT